MGKLYQHFTDRIPGFLFSIGLMHRRITDRIIKNYNYICKQSNEADFYFVMPPLI